MARTYKRDSNGRFAGGGGGSGSRGGGKKAGGGKKGNEYGVGAIANRKKAIQQKVVKGKASDQQRRFIAAQNLGIIGSRMTSGGKGNKAARRAAAATARSAQAARNKQFSSKAAPNTAKAKYKAATSKVRELKMYRGGKTDATVRNAQARVARMEKSRKSSRARI